MRTFRSILRPIMRPFLLLRVCVPALAAIPLTALPAAGQWSNDVFENTPVCTEANIQAGQAGISDGEGGVIIAWQDYRSSSSWDVYVQRLDADGVRLWSPGGVLVSGGAGSQDNPVITTDGAGGAIVCWNDARSGTFDLYAQRIDATGVPQWTANGVPVTTAAQTQVGPAIISDEAGGAIIGWMDNRTGDNDVYAQRLSASGAALWTANGIAICALAQTQGGVRAVPDGAGGVIFGWVDYRNVSDWDIYAQRVASTGLIQWAVNGAVVVAAGNHQDEMVMVSDGAGGAAFVWRDLRNNTDYNIWAQRLGPNGAALWGSSGSAVATAPLSQLNPRIAAAGDGGAFFAWADYRSGSESDLYVQRMGPDGVRQWTTDGVLAAWGPALQFPWSVVPMGPAGWIVTISHQNTDGYYDVSATHITPSGGFAWQNGPMPVTTRGSHQLGPGSVPDGRGGAIVFWEDRRTAPGFDVYAQRLDRFGYPGENSPHLVSVADVPSDQGGSVAIRWDRAGLDEYPRRVVSHYTVWRSVEPGAITAGARFFRGDEGFEAHPAPMVRITGAGGATEYWELVGSQEAHYRESYRFTAPTPSDSTASGFAWAKFFVSAHTADPFVFWDSDADSGYSVDNLAPGAVAGLTAAVEPGPAVRLSWPPNTADLDVKQYDVHRSTVNGFAPSPATLIGLTADTSFLDGGPTATGVNYYRVVTVDLHDNRSAPSPQASATLSQTVSYAMGDKWNLISVPLAVADYAKTVLYPTAVSNAFAFEGLYVADSILENGRGYWLKFDGAQSVDMTGIVTTRDTFDVSAGWNMVGSIGEAVAVGTIESSPPGIVTSNFFEFDAMYQAASSIEPGKGYWVKVTQTGKLILSSTGAADPAARIVIRPEREEPPPPPVRTGIGSDRR